MSATSNLKLDFGLSLRRDLLALDVGVLQVDGERVGTRAHHPCNPLTHDNLKQLTIFIADELFLKN